MTRQSVADQGFGEFGLLLHAVWRISHDEIDARGWRAISEEIVSGRGDGEPGR